MSMSTHPASAHPWRDAFSAYGTGMLIALAASPLLLMAVRPDAIDRRERRVCDAAVATLLDSHELVEVTRAGILVRELRCSVGRRLPPEPRAP